MGIQVNGKTITVKQAVEAVFDFFIVLVAIGIAGAIFLPEDATLAESLPALAIVAAIGLLTWKVAAAHKLVDK